MSRGDPELWQSLLVALGLALGAAAFLVALIGKPTWVVRIGAVALVVVILMLVAVWHWGFREGAAWRTESKKEQQRSGILHAGATAPAP